MATKVDIFSGFLGAGKTTLIKKLISDGYNGQKLVLIENEFGEIGIDGGFLKEAGIEITEMNSGCICCTLVGDFGAALKKVLAEYHPDRILIEPSGVGKLSDVMVAVEKAVKGEAELGATVAVADASKVKLYMKNFGEFYNNQIETANCIVLSRTQLVKEEKLKAAIELIRQHNNRATLVTTPWDKLSGMQLREAMDANPTLDDMMQELIAAHEEEEIKHEAEHHHHHDHDEEHEHHHHHHHADDVFTSWGRETAKQFTEDELKEALKALDNALEFGIILRAKGIVPTADGRWLHFDYVPGELEVRYGPADVIGKLCVIGSKIDEQAIAELFGV